MASATSFDPSNSVTSSNLTDSSDYSSSSDSSTFSDSFGGANSSDPPQPLRGYSDGTPNPTSR